MTWNLGQNTINQIKSSIPYIQIILSLDINQMYFAEISQLFNI